MLSLLKSDFKEFSSTIAEDTSLAVGQVKVETLQTLEFMDLKRNSEEVTRKEADDEALFRMSIEEVYTSPLQREKASSTEGEDPFLEDYLRKINIQDKTSEIAELLQLHSTTLKVRFEELVPVHVSYEDFWKRFFYRCDARRIEQAWAIEEEQTRDTRRRAVAAVKKALGTPVLMITSPINAAVNKLSTSPNKKRSKAKTTANSETTVTTNFELNDLHAALNTSNKRIASLQRKLQECKQRLQATEKSSCTLKKGDVVQVLSDVSTPLLEQIPCDEKNSNSLEQSENSFDTALTENSISECDAVPIAKNNCKIGSDMTGAARKESIFSSTMASLFGMSRGDEGSDDSDGWDDDTVEEV